MYTFTMLKYMLQILLSTISVQKSFQNVDPRCDKDLWFEVPVEDNEHTCICYDLMPITSLQQAREECARFDATVTNPDTEDEFAKISFMIVSIGKFKGKKTYLDYGGKIIALDSKSDEVPASEVVPSGESFYLTCRLDKTACAKKIWNGESGSHGTDDGPMSE
ncbi:uncharacterized protein LOC142354022 isoform X2 [Convolutriloba macropyga]|uniref:uncharacterized protein LOC142354022 isoform X2 n=1 Tax=Convolutriloba macropyga TaxID=536237 RepID=UPI003F523449